MRSPGLLQTIIEGIHDACLVWHEEFRQVFKDEGVLMFFLVVPLAYPLLYSWIYNNETVEEVPVVVIDDSHSFASREFIRKCDASSEVRIAYYASDMDEAKMLMGRQEAKAIYRIPADFQTRIMRLEPTAVSVY